MSGEWYTLHAISVADWPPSDEARDSWSQHYVRQLERLTTDGTADPAARMREEIEFRERDAHPWVKRFHLEALALAVSRLSLDEQAVMAGQHRPRGRPPATGKQFWARYREAAQRCRIGATDGEIAEQMVVRSKGELSRGISERQLQRLIQKHGRPADLNGE